MGDVERDDHLVAIILGGKVELASALVQGHERSTGRRAQRLVLFAGGTPQLRVHVREDEDVLLADRLGDDLIQLLLELHDIRGQLDVPQLVLVGFHARLVAGADANVLRRDVVCITHGDADTVACIEVGHVDGLESVDRDDLHAVLEKGPAAVLAAALAVGAHALDEVVPRILARPRHAGWSLDVGGDATAVLGDEAAIARQLARLGEKRPQSAGHGLGVADRAGVAERQQDVLARQLVVDLTLGQRDLDASRLRERVVLHGVRAVRDTAQAVIVVLVHREQHQPLVVEHHVDHQRVDEAVAGLVRHVARVRYELADFGVRSLLAVAVGLHAVGMERERRDLARHEIDHHAHVVLSGPQVAAVVIAECDVLEQAWGNHRRIRNSVLRGGLGLLGSILGSLGFAREAIVSRPDAVGKAHVSAPR